MSKKKWLIQKAKMAFQDAFNKVRYLFRPATVIVTCLTFMAIADLIGILLINFVSTSSTAYDVILALITGVTASVIVAVIIEMVNNYQRNNKRWLFLTPLYSTLLHYSSESAIGTGHYDSNKSHVDLVTQIHRDLVAQGQESEEEANAAIEKASSVFLDDEDDTDEDRKRDHDRIRWVFSRLPDIIPQIDDAYRNHADVLSRNELDSMDTILVAYQQIEDVIKMEVMERSTILYGRDPKDPGDLVTWLPKRIKKDLGRSILLTLAQEERQAEWKKTAEALIHSGSLLAVGIELSEDLVDNESDDDASEADLDSASSRFISAQVSRIDHELLSLQKMIKSEPGFGSFFSLMQERERPYLR